MMQSEPEAVAPRMTGRIWDITGAETALILVSAPGDEVFWFGGLIAEACARGRPPFVMVIGDGAHNDAHDAARASRAACMMLGLPAERLLFAGLRQAAFPKPGEPLFHVLKAAITRISWRYDCNVIGLVLADAHAPGSASIFELASDIAEDNSLDIFAATPNQPQMAEHRGASVWRFEMRRWRTLKHQALTCHNQQVDQAANEDELFIRL